MKDIPEEIISKAAEGDTEAFRSLYEETADMVYAVALRVSHSKEDAEEISQEVFLKVYSHLKQFKYKSSFKTWIYRITMNAAINFAKKNAKWKKTFSFDESFFEEDKMMLSDDYHQQKEQKIQELLSWLNPDQRACMLLRVVEGLSYKEIAEILQVNINTVRTRLIRARKALLLYKKKNKGTF